MSTGKVPASAQPNTANPQSCCKFCWGLLLVILAAPLLAWMVLPLVSSDGTHAILNFIPIKYLLVLFALITILWISLGAYYWFNPPSISGLVWLSWRVIVFLGFSAVVTPFSIKSLSYDGGSGNFSIQAQNFSSDSSLFITGILLLLFSMLFAFVKQIDT